METRRMCPHCRAFITTSDRTCPYCNESVAPKRVERASSGRILGGMIPNAGYLTILILLVNSGLYLATALYSNSGGRGNFMDVDVQTLYAFGAKYGPAIAAGQWWRLVTAGFLHGGILHILMNSWVLFDLGAQVDEFYGNSRMLVIYFIGTVVGFYASYLWSPVVSVGASAGICGLIGAMIAFNVHSQSGMGLAIRSMYIRWALYV